MPRGKAWTSEENDEFLAFWRTNRTVQTLVQRIRLINPNRPFESITRRIRRERAEGEQKPKEAMISQLRVGFLDIETTGLQGDINLMLSWYIKPHGSKEYDYAVITKSELFNGQSDKRLTSELMAAFDNYDILWTHYGSDYRFDVPFIRTRVLKHNLDDKLPRIGEMFIRDTYPLLKKKLRLHNNRLESAADLLGVKIRKTRLSPDIWVRAAYGDKEALEYVAVHNRHDVDMLEAICERLRIIEPQTLVSM